jgi:MoaA/NifB/PqqE/SkfB family radical SAM enzyme
MTASKDSRKCTIAPNNRGEIYFKIMKNSAVRELTSVLGDRPIVIWGARMTGIGFCLFAKKHALGILGFVDSDPSLTGKRFYDYPVALPNEIPLLKEQYERLLVVVAVTAKEDEITDYLHRMGFAPEDVLQYKDFCDSFFAIDIAGTCNLKCPSCANSLSFTEYAKGFMSLADFKRVVEKIGADTGIVSHIALFNWGEPLLHPQIDLMIDYAHTMGIAVAVSTNLSIVSDKRLRKLVQSSPDVLKVSLSGYFPETYSKTHTGGDITLVKSNLYRLRYYMKRSGSSFSVEVNYHLYKHNTGKDLAKMQDLCKELDFVFSTTYANFGPVERVIAYCEGKLQPKDKDFLDLYLVGIDKGLEIAKPFSNLPCRFQLNQVNINWDRSVSLCCASHDRGRSVICKD